MTPRLGDIWVYLSTSPLLWLTATLAAYVAAFWLYQRAGFLPTARSASSASNGLR